MAVVDPHGMANHDQSIRKQTTMSNLLEQLLRIVVVFERLTIVDDKLFGADELALRKHIH